MHGCPNLVSTLGETTLKIRSEKTYSKFCQTFFYNSSFIYGEGGYPSGHIVYAIMIFGMIAYLAEKHSKTQTGTIVKYLMFLLILLNLWTRISGLHHWPSDVIGGVLLSTPAFLIVIWLYKRVPAFIERSPKIYKFVFEERSY